MKRDSNLIMNTILFQKMDSNLLERDSNQLMKTMFFQKMDSNHPERDSNLKGYFLNRTFEINHGFESKSNGFESITVKHDSNIQKSKSSLLCS